MKIAFLALKGLPYPGGVERYTEEVASRLAARDHAVRVYAIGYRTAVPRSYRGMEVRRVPAIPQRSLEKPSAALAAALREIVGDSDIVHVNAFGPSLFGILPHIAGKRVVVQGHGLEWRRAKWGPLGKTFLQFAEWASVRFPAALTVVSQGQREYLRAKYGVDAVVIPPGVSPVERVSPQEIHRFGLRGDDYLLFASRIEPEKGLAHLLRAYRSLAPGKKLVVAGDNPLNPAYREEMHALAGGDPNVIFTGFATGRLLAELFSNCYLFVLPSEMEGLPIALLEAMSYGCAPLTSDIPENREALGGHGFTFRDRDPVDLARKLAELIARPDVVKQEREVARAYVLSRFSWDQVAIDLEALYERAIMELPGAGRLAS